MATNLHFFLLFRFLQYSFDSVSKQERVVVALVVVVEGLVVVVVVAIAVGVKVVAVVVAVVMVVDVFGGHPSPEQSKKIDEKK